MSGERGVAPPCGAGEHSAVTVAVLVVVALAVALPAEALDVAPPIYQAAAAAGRVGVVSGRAVEETRRRNAPDTPMSGFSVTLVPRSADFLARLHAIANRGRTDPAAFTTTAADIVAARQQYERALAEAGAAELVKYRPVETDGRFEIPGVPEGEWLLVALRPVFVAKPAPPVKHKPTERDKFTPQPRVIGYYAVTVWVRDLSVAAGQETTVDLTDRNMWMTAIEEKTEPGAGR